MHENSESLLLLVTAEGTHVCVSRKAARLSLFLEKAVYSASALEPRQAEERLGLSRDAEGSGIVLEVTNEGRLFSEGVLVRIAKYLEHFALTHEVPSVVPQPFPGDALDTYITKWEQSFIDDDLLSDGDVWQHDTLVQVRDAASRLEIQCLVDLLGAWTLIQIRQLVEGRTAMEGAAAIRDFFALPIEWSESELQLLQEESEFYDMISVSRCASPISKPTPLLDGK